MTDHINQGDLDTLKRPLETALLIEITQIIEALQKTMKIIEECDSVLNVDVRNKVAQELFKLQTFLREARDLIYGSGNYTMDGDGSKKS